MSCVAVEAPAKTRKIRLSDAEIARRTAQIVPHARSAGYASILATTPEQRRVWQSKGGKTRGEAFKMMADAMKPETATAIRARRIKLEGKRDKLLDHLIKCAGGEGDLQSDLSIIKAALMEMRTEIGLLLDREQRATASTPPPDTGTRAPTSQPAPVAPAVQPDAVTPSPVEALPSVPTLPPLSGI